MASGPEHYQKAEELLVEVENLAGIDAVSLGAIQILLDLAKAHVALANTAVAAASLLVDGRESPAEAWRGVIA